MFGKSSTTAHFPLYGLQWLNQSGGGGSIIPKTLWKYFRCSSAQRSVLMVLRVSAPYSFDLKVQVEQFMYEVIRLTK